MTLEDKAKKEEEDAGMVQTMLLLNLFRVYATLPTWTTESNIEWLQSAARKAFRRLMASLPASTGNSDYLKLVDGMRAWLCQSRTEEIRHAGLIRAYQGLAHSAVSLVSDMEGMTLLHHRLREFMMAADAIMDEMEK